MISVMARAPMEERSWKEWDCQEGERGVIKGVRCDQNNACDREDKWPFFFLLCLVRMRRQQEKLKEMNKEMANR